MTNENVRVICDMQFGSTGKGLIAGQLAEKDQPTVAITAWGPNSGHTYIDSEGNKMVHTMLANSVVSPKMKHVLIGPGSCVNLSNLENEIAVARLQGHMEGVSVHIHPNAAIVSSRHIHQEDRSMTGIGSTKKGTGAAAAEKIARQVDGHAVAYQQKGDLADRLEKYLISADDYYDIVHDPEADIVIEGSQGFSLGVNSGSYPYTTYRECSVSQILSDTLVPSSKVYQVIGAARTYPIRVANRYDRCGQMVGYSGPGYPDQTEIKWSDIGVEPEKTTVTKLERRVFTWSFEQIKRAMMTNHTCDHNVLFLNFINYVPFEEQGQFMEDVGRYAEQYGWYLGWVGKGPEYGDVWSASSYHNYLTTGVPF